MNRVCKSKELRLWGHMQINNHICHSKTKPSDALNRSPSSGSGGAAPRIMLCTRITMLDPATELRQRVRPVRFEVRLAVNLLKCHPNMSIQSHQLRTSNNSFSRTHMLTVLNEQNLYSLDDASVKWQLQGAKLVEDDPHGPNVSRPRIPSGEFLASKHCPMQYWKKPYKILLGCSGDLTPLDCFSTVKKQS